MQYLADRRLEELGFEPHYNVANPAKWMAAANDTLQLVNFFEATNTSLRGRRPDELIRRRHLRGHSGTPEVTLHGRMRRL